MKRLITLYFFLLINIFSFQNLSFAQDTISPPNPDGVTNVYISVFINNIINVDAANQTITADIVFRARWNDPRLKHDLKSAIVASGDEIWDPFLTISNRLNVSKSFPDNYTILKDGTVIYFQRVYGEFTQRFLLNEFPFDEQTFEIRMVNLDLNPKEVMLVPDTSITTGKNDELSLSDWKIKSWSLKNSPYTFIKGGAERSTLLFSVIAKRESGYYIIIFMIPLVLIIVMSLLAFWLPEKLSASRIAVGTTSMLTLIAYRFVVSSELPKISYMTRMDLFILGSSVLIFLTLVESVMTSTLNSKGKIDLAERIDFNCRWIFPVLYFFIALYALFL